LKPPVKPAVEIHGFAPVVIDGVEHPSDDLLLATGADARRIASDLAELRALRSKRIRPKVFRRRGSRFWQIRYPDGKGGLRDESTRSENRRDAQALADFRAYEASAGVLPSTATFEQIIDALVHDAEVRGRKVARPARAARALKAKLAGHRAEACDYAVWLKYAVDREKEASRDTVNLELAIARRAYRWRAPRVWSRTFPSYRASAGCTCVRVSPIRGSGSSCVRSSARISAMRRTSRFSAVRA
jgi:hypothetical protein